MPDMKNEEQRIAVAEACGFNWIHPWQSTSSGDEESPLLVLTKLPKYHCSLYESNLGERFIGRDVPWFLVDLNAMHEAEKVLTSVQYWEFVEWLSKLIHMRHVDFVAHSTSATAAQRAEALLRTLNLWKE
jgi:hypothetical protein